MGILLKLPAIPALLGLNECKIRLPSTSFRYIEILEIHMYFNYSYRIWMARLRENITFDFTRDRLICGIINLKIIRDKKIIKLPESNDYM